MKRKLSIVITPGSLAQTRLSEEISNLRRHPVLRKLPIEWVQSDKLYLDLVYLGAVTEQAQTAAFDAVYNTSVRFQPFEVLIGNLSYLYTAKKGLGSEIVFEISDKERRLKELYRDLENELSEAGFSPSKHFKPAITIGFLKRQRYEHVQKEILDTLVEQEITLDEPFLVETLDFLNVLFDDLISPRKTHLKSFSLGLV